MKEIEVSESAEEEEPRKLRVTCATCGITKSFYTPQGVRHFELTHMNHIIRRERVETESVEEEPTPQTTPDSAETERPPELPTEVLEKLVVSVAISGLEGKQSFRVLGMGPEEKYLFVLNFPLVNASEVKALVESGEYAQDEIPPMGRFTWTPPLLEVSEQAGMLLGLRKPEAKPETPKVEIPPAPVEVKEVEVQPELETPKVEIPPAPVEVKEVGALPEPEKVKRFEKVGRFEIIARTEVRKETPLLLAKSSYIPETEENTSEAIRISKVLTEFRWNVTPPYGINVLLDDNVSIQSNTGVISSNVIRKIESIGYLFVAFEVSKGVPTAWFKRRRNGDNSQLSLFPDIGEVVLPQASHDGNGFSSLGVESVQ